MYICYVHPYSTYLAELHNVVNRGEMEKGFGFLYQYEVSR